MAFGPGSLLYESYGDRIGYLVAPRAGLLQLMYPDLGRGVEQHSAFYTEPWERLFRSVPQIVGTIFDGEHAQGTADQVREFHRDIKGSHEDGTRYHALDPDTYFWAHATFTDAAFTTNSLFKLNPLDVSERRAYYLECVEWWQMYGLSMRPVPPSYDDFLVYWNHMVTDVLEPTPAAVRLVEMMRNPTSMAQPWLPDPVWKVVAAAGMPPYMWVTTATLPPQAREMFGLRWSRADDAAFAIFRRVVAAGWAVLPDRLTLLPRARAAYRRTGRIGLPAARRALNRRREMNEAAA
jgi:uncharacterized protein (DUF2236 family)